MKRLFSILAALTVLIAVQVNAQDSIEDDREYQNLLYNGQASEYEGDQNELDDEQEDDHEESNGQFDIMPVSLDFIPNYLNSDPLNVYPSYYPLLNYQNRPYYNSLADKSIDSYDARPIFDQYFGDSGRLEQRYLQQLLNQQNDYNNRLSSNYREPLYDRYQEAIPREQTNSKPYNINIVYSLNMCKHDGTNTYNGVSDLSG